MPLIEHNNLPTFEYLRKNGENILSKKRALKQFIRELHIGILNMMPDPALCATERQFFKLVGNSNKVVQFYIHLFTLKSIKRDEKTTEYIKKYYQSFDNIKEFGLDALIITGANVTGKDLSKENFYKELTEVVNWSYENVTSTLYSCLATHIVMQSMYKQKRTKLNKKCWGVYFHKIIDKSHPLVKDTNTLLDIPHSRFNQITAKQFTESGLKILIESKQGVHLAVSKDLFRQVFFQGHPEYDTISLLKEYKREIKLFLSGINKKYPIFPDNYLDKYSKAVLLEYKEKIIKGYMTLDDFPEQLITKKINNTWGDSAKSIISNWTGIIYQITHKDRKKPFMDGINKDNPLESLTQ